MLSNMEDSLIYDKSAAERGAYRGLSFNFIKTELDKDEKFATPSESTTLDLKTYANYSKIKAGVVQKGTIVKKDDVVIGKVAEIPKPIDARLYKDTSILYPYGEEAMVDFFIREYNADDEEFIKVKFSSVRTLGIGDKFSSRSG